MPLLGQDQEKSFAQIMNESMIEGLSSVIGKAGCQALLFNFRLKEKVMNPAAFHEAMVAALKDGGARLLERAVIQEAYKKVGGRLDSSIPFDFEREFNLTKNLFLKGDIR
jgi:hypothetical protein